MKAPLKDDELYTEEAFPSEWTFRWMMPVLMVFKGDNNTATVMLKFAYTPGGSVELLTTSYCLHFTCRTTTRPGSESSKDHGGTESSAG